VILVGSRRLTMVARPAIDPLGLLLTLMASCGAIGAQQQKLAEAPAKADAQPAVAKERDRAAEAVTRLVEQLRRHPARPSAAADRLALHLMDVETGEDTLIADEPDEGLVRIGSTSWSHDGRRILFDAMPMNQPGAAHLKVIELEGGRVAINDLGPGNCPSLSPDDGRIVFLLNTAPQTGVWLMQADGSNRRILGSYGRPLWSPDSRQFMIVNFNLPRLVTMMNVDPTKNGVVRIAGNNVYPEPCWVGEGTIVAAIGSNKADTIALVDVRQPRNAKIKEVLWRRSDGPNVMPYYPLYSPRTRRCVFVGIEPRGMALYSFQQGRPERPRRLGPEGLDTLIQDTALSPDGRYVLFCSTRPAHGHAEAGKERRPTERVRF
jgi:Tol biopolymer transport system component